MNMQLPMNKYVYWILFIYLHQVCAVGPPPHPPDLQGSYCEARKSHQCCSDRQDDCSAPIMGTKCYCDDFCNRTKNEDCCPDFWTFCKGYSVPEVYFKRSCEHQGISYNENSTVKLNCRECKCQSIGNGDEVKLLCDDAVCLIDEDLLDRVNRNYQSLSWKASNYSIFWGRSYDEGLALRLGTKKTTKKEVKETLPVNSIFDPKSIPLTFDSRLVWPGMISRPRDQGWCGSSWIFSTVSVASDRFAIMTYGNDMTFLSPQHLLDCAPTQQSCEGGYLTKAWTFIRRYGIVPDTCYPWEGRQSKCKVPRIPRVYKAKIKYQEAMCPFSSLSQTAELHRVGPVYRIAHETGIMYEISKSGPVQATMKVTKEFFSYRSGIFRCTNLSPSDRSGYHSVRIIGWGEEVVNYQLIKYWIVANSWGEWWGESGYFRIQRGVNECDIEDFVIAVWPNVEDMKIFTNTIKQSEYVYNNRV